MKTKDIYTGTIKKVNNLYCYKKYGEERYGGHFKTSSLEVGQTHKYVEVVEKSAVLIKLNDDEYVWVDFLTNFIEEALANFGISFHKISIIPHSDNQLFVDKNTIQPYFKNEDNKDISVKKLKRLIR